MRLLLTSAASYAPPRGGATRSNLVWLKLLAASGHQCRVVCSTFGTDDSDLLEDEGVAIRRVPDLPRNLAVLGEEIGAYAPDHLLVSSEDVSHQLLREADRVAPGRVTYLAHTPQLFPFGPESWNPDAAATRVVQRARGVVAIGKHMAAYIERYSGVKPAIVHPPIYGSPPYPRFGGFGTGSILMINPCAVKGIGIFLELARIFPECPFDALAGWGTTPADREALHALPNVRVLRNVPAIDDVLARARLLLMPSVWYEGFGLIVMEAMLRGLPVISSDSGGLMEAKAGTHFVIPVRPVERYEMSFDENHMPRPVTGNQEINPWLDALRVLLGDERAYSAESELSRETALRFVSHVRASAFEEYLLSRPVRKLTPDQRELLLKKLREKGSA